MRSSRQQIVFDIIEEQDPDEVENDSDDGDASLEDEEEEANPEADDDVDHAETETVSEDEPYDDGDDDDDDFEIVTVTKYVVVEPTPPPLPAGAMEYRWGPGANPTFRYGSLSKGKPISSSPESSRRGPARKKHDTMKETDPNKEFAILPQGKRKDRERNASAIKIGQPGLPARIQLNGKPYSDGSKANSQGTVRSTRHQLKTESKSTGEKVDAWKYKLGKKDRERNDHLATEESSKLQKRQDPDVTSDAPIDSTTDQPSSDETQSDQTQADGPIEDAPPLPEPSLDTVPEDFPQLSLPSVPDGFPTFGVPLPNPSATQSDPALSTTTSAPALSTSETSNGPLLDTLSNPTDILVPLTDLPLIFPPPSSTKNVAEPISDSLPTGTPKDQAAHGTDTSVFIAVAVTVSLVLLLLVVGFILLIRSKRRSNAAQGAKATEQGKLGGKRKEGNSPNPIFSVAFTGPSPTRETPPQINTGSRRVSMATGMSAKDRLGPLEVGQRRRMSHLQQNKMANGGKIQRRSTSISIETSPGETMTPGTPTTPSQQQQQQQQQQGSAGFLGLLGRKTKPGPNVPLSPATELPANISWQDNRLLDQSPQSGQPGPGYHETEISALAAAVAAAAAKRPNNGEGRDASASSSLSSISTIPSDSGEEYEFRYEVVVPWIPQRFDELALAPGETVVVYKVYEDGWCDGRLLVSGEEGVFPMACLRGRAWSFFGILENETDADPDSESLAVSSTATTTETETPASSVSESTGGANGEPTKRPKPRSELRRSVLNPSSYSLASGGSPSTQTIASSQRRSASISMSRKGSTAVIPHNSYLSTNTMPSIEASPSSNLNISMSSISSSVTPTWPPATPHPDGAAQEDNGLSPVLEDAKSS
ncbi:hypothetical protein HDU97_007579 [Phlyctochytrium planicorne]|nr:hypothetical protein HDU97_007579 [Phlyctochytrium planicorne]